MTRIRPAQRCSTARAFRDRSPIMIEVNELQALFVELTARDAGFVQWLTLTGASLGYLGTQKPRS